MSNQVATVERKSIVREMATRHGMEPEAFESTLRATVFPPGGTKEQFAAFLMVARDYGLNPVLKEIYAFPAKGGGIVPIVSVDGWSRLINDNPAFDGMEFVDERDGNGKLISITCKMHRKDRAHPVCVIEYMSECARPTEPWKQWPARMLRHKAMIQCARYAFGFTGIYDQDEAERMIDVTPKAPVAPTPIDNINAAIKASKEPEPTIIDVTSDHDPHTGEVREPESSPVLEPPVIAVPMNGTVPDWQAWADLVESALGFADSDWWIHEFEKRNAKNLKTLYAYKDFAPTDAVRMAIASRKAELETA